MTAILGLSAFYHDSAAALVVDGEIVAAAQEERFSRIKHDDRFPARAAADCLEQAGIDAGELDFVVFHEKPLVKFDRWIETVMAFAPRGVAAFVDGAHGWMHERLHVPLAIRRGLGGRFRRRVLFAEHHASHAASAFLPSPFDEAAILTVDGVGEWATATLGRGRGRRVELLRELRFPHSPGLLYSAFTSFCGFEVNEGEYKLMGLAPYGEPRFAETILREIVDLRPDGSFRLDQSYFDYCAGRRMTSRRFARLFGGPPRRPETEIGERERDLAASIQHVTEEILLRMARHAHALTGSTRLCLAGGVALNGVANGRVLREGPFEEIWIQPAAGDAGAALGAALLVWHELLGNDRRAGPRDAMHGARLGPAFDDAEVRAAFDEAGAVHRVVDDEAALCGEVAQLLEAGKVVGWMQGRMEFGPRALGGRSILADPRDPAMPERINRAIKFREPFRPFAPAVLRERAAEFFDLDPGQSSAYMLLVADVRPERRGDIPAVTHVDGSARVQTVEADGGRFRRLLETFAERTGMPVLVNTSFNVRGEPIVRTPHEALRCFLTTDLDVLVVENCVLLKAHQPEGLAAASRPVAPSRPRRRFALLDREPDRRFLATFSLGLVAVFGLLGWLWYGSAGPSTASLVAWALGGLLGVGGLVAPAFALGVYRAWTTILAPLAWLLTSLVLAIVYYAMITPIALLRRLGRGDPLALKRDAAAETYWRPRRQSGDPAAWFRQS